MKTFALPSRAFAAILAMLVPAPVAAQQAPAAQPGEPVSRWVVELEGGPAWQSYNDVEIPNDGTASRFSLYDLAGAGPWPAGRLYVTWNLNDRHALRLLLAPFSLTETGTPARALSFAGGTFAAGGPTDATYTFNSYRLTYRYRFHEGARPRRGSGSRRRSATP